MANAGFTGAQWPMSMKQCVMAYDFHKDCMGRMKSENEYLCPDTLAAYKRWCPDNVRRRHHIRETEEAISRKLWTQHDLDGLNSN